ncbi:Polyadenylate-binding protein-interacting protein 11, partial [Ananas comosus]
MAVIEGTGVVDLGANGDYNGGGGGAPDTRAAAPPPPRISTGSCHRRRRLRRCGCWTTLGPPVPVLGPTHPSAFHIGAHHFARGGEELVRSAAAAGGGGHRSIGAEAAGAMDSSGDAGSGGAALQADPCGGVRPPRLFPPSTRRRRGADSSPTGLRSIVDWDGGVGGGGCQVFLELGSKVTEEQLAALFINCGQVVDCRVCGDPNSVLRFAFIEFTDEDGARAALNLSGTVLGYYPVRVLPSKTAIAPVNPTFLPRSDDEREMCARTVYCTNIDKKVSQADVKLFFESICGEVYRLRLLGDYH